MISTKSGKNLFDYTEVSELVGVHVNTICRYAQELGLSYHIEKGKRYFDEAQLVKLLEKKNNARTRGKAKS